MNNKKQGSGNPSVPSSSSEWSTKKSKTKQKKIAKKNKERHRGRTRGRRAQSTPNHLNPSTQNSLSGNSGSTSTIDINQNMHRTRQLDLSADEYNWDIPINDSTNQTNTANDNNDVKGQPYNNDHDQKASDNNTDYQPQRPDEENLQTMPLTTIKARITSHNNENIIKGMRQAYEKQKSGDKWHATNNHGPKVTQSILLRRIADVIQYGVNDSYDHDQAGTFTSTRFTTDQGMASAINEARREINADIGRWAITNDEENPMFLSNANYEVFTQSTNGDLADSKIVKDVRHEAIRGEGFTVSTTTTIGGGGDDPTQVPLKAYSGLTTAKVIIWLRDWGEGEQRKWYVENAYPNIQNTYAQQGQSVYMAQTTTTEDADYQFTIQ
ncbi:hypothetical protein D0962_21855 [Leptolyngbyaceae cyanobacterium CCMR0082]|uniref:Uncharacterized protein n=1 Tax=Adonisia turfae CCMR0082 TaxID=2304604 RepID=A0A6M0SBB8_9CYAN|nr:hypothetical protein [Adonisia turfae]NEZ65383.1 hypothetical protein [Adonisia turfae CCMR0082]